MAVGMSMGLLIFPLAEEIEEDSLDGIAGTSPAARMRYQCARGSRCCEHERETYRPIQGRERPPRGHFLVAAPASRCGRETPSTRRPATRDRGVQHGEPGDIMLGTPIAAMSQSRMRTAADHPPNAMPGARRPARDPRGHRRAAAHPHSLSPARVDEFGDAVASTADHCRYSSGYTAFGRVVTHWYPGRPRQTSVGHGSRRASPGTDHADAAGLPRPRATAESSKGGTWPTMWPSTRTITVNGARPRRDRSR